MSRCSRGRNPDCRVVVRSRVPLRRVDAPIAPRPFWPPLRVPQGFAAWVLRCACHTLRRTSLQDEFLEMRLPWAPHTAEGGGVAASRTPWAARLTSALLCVCIAAMRFSRWTRVQVQRRAGSITQSEPHGAGAGTWFRARRRPRCFSCGLTEGVSSSACV